MKKLTLQNASVRRQHNLKPPIGQQGFIPLMLCIIAVIALIIFFVYSRVMSVQR